MRRPSRFTMLAIAVALGAALTASAIAEGAPASRSGGCVVPRLARTPVSVARLLLPRLGCRLGTIVRRPSIAVDRGAVIATRPAPGRYSRGRRVNLVVSAGPAAGLRSVGISGRGSDDDPYTGACTDKVDGSCRITFGRITLGLPLDSEDIPAYRCPDSDPWLLKKSLGGGRIVPPGVLVEQDGLVGTTITRMFSKEGKTKAIGPKVYIYEYATGTKRGFPNTATAWSNKPSYTISIYCTSDLAKANLVNVRG